jgi:restriction system protein
LLAAWFPRTLPTNLRPPSLPGCAQSALRRRGGLASFGKGDRTEQTALTDLTDLTAPEPMEGPHKKLRPSGGYRKTASFQTTTLIYDATVWFCEKFLNARSRTVDQMVQAARSGRQNIAEGSRASATSSQTELRLVNVARASLEELLLDYEDYLRHRHLPQWAADSVEVGAVRAVASRVRKDQSDRSDQGDLTDLTDQQRHALYARWLDHADPAVRSNAIICLIHQANYLLDRQIAALEAAFISEGGYSEQLATARLTQRRKDQTDRTGQADRTDLTPPECPQCGALMGLRTAKGGKNPGSQFWGCTRYPECKGVVSL